MKLDQCRSLQINSILIKVYEKIILERIEQDKHNWNRLLNARQRGFVKGKDTLKHVQEIIDKISNITRNNGEQNLLFIDFKEAFD